jgi:hypothetical protein
MKPPVFWALWWFGILVCLTPAFAYWQTRDSTYNVSGGGTPFTPSCTPSTNFIARTSGLTNPQKTNYDTLICGLETDSVGCVTGSEMIGLYVLAAPDATTALLNLCSSSFSLVYHGSRTFSAGFSANNGYTGDGGTSSEYLDTGIVPNTCCALNSLSIGAYITSSRTVTQTWSSIGGGDTIEYTFIQPLTTALFIYDINGGAFQSVANGQAKGNWIATRTGINTTAAYLNSNLTPFLTGTGNSTGPTPENIYVSALNDNSTPSRFSGDQISFAFVGNGLTAANAKLVADRLNAFAKFTTGYGTPINAY